MNKPYAAIEYHPIWTIFVTRLPIILSLDNLTETEMKSELWVHRAIQFRGHSHQRTLHIYKPALYHYIIIIQSKWVFYLIYWLIYAYNKS